MLLNDSSGPISRGGYRLATLGDAASRQTLVLLSFSGGGKRSAAFGYGVLRGLRDFPVAIGGRQSRLLDQIDVMSSVSGGSFPAAYYALHRDGIFTDFEKDFLNQDINAYVYGTYLIPWHLGWLFDPNYGTNDRMAEVYDKLMFHGATYADLVAKGRPLVSIDATDVDHGLAFPFLQAQFDLMCSDLSSYPLARAVAASNGFPVIFTPITLKSYRSQCGGRVPGWVSADTAGDSACPTAPAGAIRPLLPRRRPHALCAPDGRRHLGQSGDARHDRSHAACSRRKTMRSRPSTMSRISAAFCSSAPTANPRTTPPPPRRSIFPASARSSAPSPARRSTPTISKPWSSPGNNSTPCAMRCARSAARPARSRPTAIPAATWRAISCISRLAASLTMPNASGCRQIPTGLTIDAADIALLVAAGEEQVRNSSGLATFRDSLAK